MISIISIFIIAAIYASIVSCGIIRQDEIALTGNERISKRSLPDNDVVDQRYTRSLLKEQLTNMGEFGDLESAANTVVFRPYLRRRFARDTELLTNEDDLETAASNIAFRPLFRNANHHFGRFGRSLNYEKDMETAARRRRARSVNVVRNSVAATELADLDVAANVIFTPLFRYKKRTIRRNRH